MVDEFLAARVEIDGLPHWLWPDGTVARIISGGDGDEPPDPKAGDPPDPKGGDPDPDADPKLGPAGEKALAAERQARAAAEKDSKAAKAELEKLKKKTQTEQEQAIDAAKAEGRTEALTVANQRIVRAEVTAAAAGKLADPSDAAALLDLSQFEVDESGNVEKKKITSAIDDLLKTKPHLAARNASTPSGDGGGGPRGTPPKDGQTMDDWLRAKALGKH